MSAGGRVIAVGAHSQALFLHAEAVPCEGETVLGWGFEETADGGKSTNQAVAAARLGAATTLVTALGEDTYGRTARALFERFGIDLRFSPARPGRTDVGFVILPPSRVPAIVTATSPEMALDAPDVEAAAAAFRGAGCVVCCLEAPQASAVAAFRLGRTAGAVTLLNAAPAVPVERELLALTDVLVANEHEAAALADAGAGHGELARRLQASTGVRLAVVTAGGAGAALSTGGEAEVLPAPAVAVVDTTGAGDGFVGALAARLAAGDDATTACAYALRAASLSVTRPGTMLSYPTAEELEPGQ